MRLGRRSGGIDAREAARRVEQGDAVFVDVREPYEWAAGRIPTARHVPLGDFQARLDEIPRDRSVIAVCRSGGRSGHVVRALRRLGYEAENLEGGIQAWTRAGLPLEPPGGRVA